MDDRKLVTISLLCSLAGLATIYAAAVPAKPRVTSIASIDNGFVGLRTIISGQVVDHREHREGHLFLKLRDSSGGVISVPIFSRTRAQLSESIELLDIVEVTGEVLLYQGELEVVPGEAGDVKVIHTAPVRISSLSEENAGSIAKVQGVMVNREIVGNGNLILTLKEDDGQIMVFVPSWVVEDGLPEMHVSDTIRVEGWLQLYNGKLELKVTSASYLHVVEAA